eukprot:11018058-Ditylum_brightwellii.AAC.1
MAIPTSLQECVRAWYHHYLQHPGHTRLEETLTATMTWASIHDMVKRHVRKCQSCQKNKTCSKQYGYMPPKNIIMNPWEALCVDLIGPYTLKGQDGSILDFMCLTMLDPATGWFKIVELPVIEIFKTDGKNIKMSETFDKTSYQIAQLIDSNGYITPSAAVDALLSKSNKQILYPTA